MHITHRLMGRRCSPDDIDPEQEARRPSKHLLQCDREPPCIATQLLVGYDGLTETGRRWCREYQNDRDWPTFEPDLVRVVGTKTARDLALLYPNSTWFFVGDSIGINMWGALVCGLQRAGMLEVGDRPRGMDPGQWRAEEARLTAVWDKMREDEKAGKIANLLTFRALPSVGSAWVAKGWGSFVAWDFAAMLERADVVVVNFGLHYGLSDLRGRYQEHMDTMFKQIDAWQAARPGRFAVYRDTGAQHFQGSGSFAHMGQARGAGRCRCYPMDWKARLKNHVKDLNNVARAAARPHVANGSAIGFLDFYDLTLERQEHHEERQCGYNNFDEARRRFPGRTDDEIVAALGPNDPEVQRSNSCCDCSHFCYSPLFWDHVFTSLHGQLSELMGARREMFVPPRAPHHEKAR